MSVRPNAGVYRGPGWSAQTGNCPGVAEASTFRRERIDMGRFADTAPVCTDGIEPLLIGQYKQKVWLRHRSIHFQSDPANVADVVFVTPERQEYLTRRQPDHAWRPEPKNVKLFDHGVLFFLRGGPP